jgi:hypothetical protein
MTAKKSASRYSRIISAFVKIPEPLENGKVRCRGCSKVVPLTPNGKIRKHRSPAGEDCAYTASYGRYALDEIPPVVMRPAPKVKELQPERPPREPRVLEPLRLYAGRHCQECDSWVSGERRLCGMCAAKRRQ